MVRIINKISGSWIKYNSLKIHLFVLIILFGLPFFTNLLFAQTPSEKIYQGITLDDVMIKEVRNGFDIDKFINKVKNDTTFYKAFKTLRIRNYTMNNEIEIYDKSDEIKASYHSITKQIRKNGCRKMNVLNEKTTGDFYTKKREYNYYTAKLYAHLFFTNGEVCGDNNIVANKKQKGTTKYEEQLRLLIFNPGQRIYGIPGIGENVAIFEEPTKSKYDFKLSKVDYFGDSCYVFKAKPKKEFESDVVINNLETWFRANDFSIIARNYSLSYKTLLYDFDVVMNVKLKKNKNELIPYNIIYKGNWHVISKAREKGDFTSIFTDFD